jgi:hypothetical protein
VQCVDQDRDALVYSLRAGTPFAINSATGVLTMASGSLDFESTPSHAVSVTCTDPSGASATATITINVLDRPEPPVFTQPCPVAMVFAEDISAGTNLGAAITATDPDQGASLSYSIRAVAPAAAAARFKIDSQSAQLALIGRLDWEAGDRTFDLTVGVSDGTFNLNCAVSITVLDVDE